MAIPVLASIIHIAGNVGLPVLFLLLMVETMGIPVPGETALIAMGIVASQGDVSIEAVIVVAAAAAIIGDNCGYWIGRTVGKDILLSDAGPFVSHRRRLYAIADPFFDKHGPKAVFLGRWVAGLRICAAWMAGASDMHWRTFAFYNAADGICWATSVGLLAFYAGHSADRVVKDAGIVGVIVAVVFIGGIWWLAHRRRSLD